MQALTHPEHAESHATHLREGYFMGCLPAVVTSVNDPNKAGRIKARANLIDEFNDLPNATDGWIPVTTRYVLTDTPGGDIAPLQVGSQIILIPIMGKMDNWICIGAIHTSAEPPHASHDINNGTYGERTPEGITHVRSGDAAEVKTYPHGVVKGVSATGDVTTKTNDTTVTQSADGKVHIENKASSMSMSPTGTVGIVNAVGSSIALNDKGTINVASAHKSSMTFVDGKVEIAGPPKGGSKDIESYKKSLAKSMGGLNEMFASIGNIDLNNLNAESINATIGTVNDVISKGQAVMADYEAAKVKATALLDTIARNPAEAIKLVSPQVSDFLDKNLDKVIPTLKAGIISKVGGQEIFNRISGYLPEGTTASLDGIQAQLSAFKTSPELATQAIVNDIYGTAVKDYESLIGPNLQYSIETIVKIHSAIAPTWTTDPTGSTKLLTEQGALATTLANSGAILATASPAEIQTKLGQLHQAEPAYLAEAIAAAWRKYRIGAITKALPKTLAAKIGEEQIDLILAAPTPTEAVSRLVTIAQGKAIAATTAPNPTLDAGLGGIATAGATLDALDRDDREESLVSLVALSGNIAFPTVGALLDRAAAVDLDKPLVRDPIGQFQQAFAAVRDRLNLRFTKEDPLCRSTIRFIFQELDRYTQNRVRVFTAQAAKDPSWKIDIIALKFQTDALIEATGKYQVSYPAINLFWDDVQATLKEFLRAIDQVDKQIAARAIAAQLRAKLAARPDDYSSTAIAKSKIVPTDWQPPQSFDPLSLVDLRKDIVQLGINIAGIPDLSGGCDSSDAKVLARADLAIKEIIVNIDRAIGAKTLLPFDRLTGQLAAFEESTVKFKLTSKIRPDALDLFNSTLVDLTNAELELATARHLETIAKQTATNRRNGNPTAAPAIAYAIAIMEYRTMGQRLLVTLQDTSKTIDYAQSVSRIVSELNVVVRDWFLRNATANSAAELIDLPAIYDLKVTMRKFIADRASYATQFPQVNLVWDEILLTTDYLMFYPTSIGASGTNQIVRNSEVKLPGSYAKPIAPTQPPVSASDWLTAAIAIAKSVMQDLTNLYPPFKEYQAVAVQALDVLPSVFPAAKVTLTDGKIDMKSSNTGSKVSLGEDTAKLASGSGAAAVSLGKGTADIDTGTVGGALKLAAGSGKLTGGPLGGEVTASTGAATLSGPGGLCSIGAGAGGLSFSTPWGGFGFGSGGFGLSGDQPVNFAVQEADYDGGASALYLDARKGVGIHSTEQYSGRVSAEINVFDGRISLRCPGNNASRIEINENGVSIGGVNMSYFSNQFNYIFSRLYALENA